MFYAIAKPNAYLAITGAGIDNVILKKKSIILPFQRVTKFSITPFDFELELQAMTAEKLKFTLPAVFTVSSKYPIVQRMLTLLRRSVLKTTWKRSRSMPSFSQETRTVASSERALSRLRQIEHMYKSSSTAFSKARSV